MTAEQAETFKKLSTVHTTLDIRLNAVALVDVFRVLEEQTSVRIEPDWNVLENAGVDREAPVTAFLKQAALSHCLRAVLADAGGGSVRLAYEVDSRGVVRVTTEEALKLKEVPRIYDVRAIVKSKVEYEAWPVIEEPIGPVRPSLATARSWPPDRMRVLRMMLAKRDEFSLSPPDCWDGRLLMFESPYEQQATAEFLDDLRAKGESDE
jgi:hypothetical protein